MEYGYAIGFAVLALLLIQLILTVILLSKNRRDYGGEVLRKLDEFDQRLEKNEAGMRNEFRVNRDEINKSAKDSRQELSGLITNFIGIIDNKMKNIQEFLDSGLKRNREELTNSLRYFETKSSAKIEALTKDTKDSLDKNRETVETKLAEIQHKNEEKLEQMRRTVDEKLHETLEKRLNESFKVVTAQLESVHQGLGEMQTLASGVGDLKKVLTNVSTRGNFGEIQLGAILEQILSNEQFEKQVVIKENSGGRVDYAIKLPNKNDRKEALLLPVDSKFPTEDYQRLIDAYENKSNLPHKDSLAEISVMSKQFEKSVANFAKDISEKYIDPPRTTDFAFMFVPTEGLFAEIAKRTALFETLQRSYKITVVGPTNFAAVLNSLQMGFQTLAIEKRSSEVWKTLGAVKTGFRNFGEALANTKKKLVAATNEIDNVETKSRTIERKLKSVGELPFSESIALIGDAELSADDEEEEGPAGN